MNQIHRTQQNNVNISTLIQLALNLLKERELLPMLQLFNPTACKLLQAQNMTVGIIEDIEHLSGAFYTTSTTNEQSDALYSTTCSLNSTLLHSLYCAQNVLRYSELSSSQLNNNNQINPCSNRPFLGVSIQSSTQTYGVIYFIGKNNETEFNEEDEYIAKIIAAELAMLYEHIKMHDHQQHIRQLQLEIISLEHIKNDLHYNQERIKLALEAGQMNAWCWDFNTTKFKVLGFFDALTRSEPGFERDHFDNFINRVIPEDREQVQNTIELAIKQRTILEVFFRTKTSENNIEHYYSIGQLFFDEQKKPQGMMGVTVIITKFKKREDLLRRNHAKITHLFNINSMGEIASFLAHELNQPLTVINTYICGCIRRIENGSKEIAPIIKAMIKVKKNIELAEDIIKGMKEFVHKGELHYDTLNINELIKTAVSLIHYEGFNDISATILFDLTEPLPDIKLDKIQIIQVLLNIIRNSIEAMNTELSKNPIITIRSAQLNTNTITITIEDNGAGIDMENYALLFTPYFTTKPDGMGLGLAISHTIISAHNGYLSARNLPQGGACFEFTLPIRAC